MNGKRRPSSAFGLPVFPVHVAVWTRRYCCEAAVSTRSYTYKPALGSDLGGFAASLRGFA